MSEKSASKLRNVGSMGLGYFVNTAQEVSLPLVFPTLKKFFSPVLENYHLALIDGVRVIIQTLLSPLWGIVSDRFSRKKVLVVGTGLWGGLVIFCGLSTQFWHLMAAWVVACLGIGALVPAGFSILADLYGPQERGKAIGILNALGMLGIVVGALGFGLIMGAAERGASLGFLDFNEAMGWRVVFFVVGAASVLAAVVMAVFVREPPRGSAEPELDEALADLAASRFRFKIADVKEIMKCGTILIAFAQGFFLLTALFLIQRFFPTWMHEERGFETSKADMVFGVIVLGLVVGTLTGGLIADWAERRWPDRGRALASQFSILVVAPGLALLVTRAHSIGAIIGASLVVAFFLEWTRRCTLQPMIQNVMRPELRGTALALAEFFQGGFASLFIIFIARYADRVGLTDTFLYWGCGCLAVAFIIAFGLYYSYPRDQARLREEMQKRREQIIGNNP